MKLTTSLIAFLILSAATALGQQAKLEGHVVNDRDARVSNVRIAAPGGQPAQTDSKGHFVVTFPSSVEPGQATRISVGKAGWVVMQPLMGNCVTQSVERNREPLSVIIVPRGSQLALKPKMLGQAIARLANERASLSKQLATSKSQVNEYAFLKEYSENYGFTLDRVLAEAKDWARNKNSADKEEQALKEYFLRNYDRAAELAGESKLEARPNLEKLNQQKIEASLQYIHPATLQGNALYRAGKFREALAVFSEIDDAFTKRLLSKEDLSAEWAETKLLRGSVMTDLGTRAEGLEGVSFLSEAAKDYRLALTVFTREQLPRQWALTENNLGWVLWAQGERLDGAEGVSLLTQAAEAFGATAEVFTRKASPEAWAMTQVNLGLVLGAQGERMPGPEGLRLIEQSVAADREALKIVAREGSPELWGMAQNNLATGLRTQAERLLGAKGAELVGQSIAASRAALQVFVREHQPQEWAGAQNNLGLALELQGQLLPVAEGMPLLAQSVEAFRQALQVYTREGVPQQWAMTQHNLGTALFAQGERLPPAEGVRLLGEAGDAFRAALLMRTREQLPQYWAGTQNNLGLVLLAQAKRVAPAERGPLFGQAIEALNAALQVYTREALPNQWMITHLNLAEVHLLSGKWPAAAASYENVLSVNPDSEEAGRTLGELDHELLKFEEAFTLRQRWLARHPGDIEVQASFAESHFTTGRFAECKQRLDILLTGLELRVDFKTPLRAIEIANLLALNQADQVPAKLARLVGEVSQQPEEFKSEWTFDGTRHFINENEKLLPYRAWLGQLFDALASQDRDTMLKALKDVQAKFKAQR